VEAGHAVSDESGVKVPLEQVPLDLPDIVINGNCARALLALDALFPGNRFDEAARGILGSLADKYGSYRYFASVYALGVELLENGLVEVRVAPDGAPQVQKEMMEAAASRFSTRKLVRLETVEDFLPGEADTVGPPAVVCAPGRCLPVNSGEELKRALDALLTDEGARERDDAAEGRT
jgi:uncharacterized protein YyaL (SSP411 family)